MLFGTADISRQYPKSYGISHYAGDPWYAQFLRPVFKSNVEGSELAANGPLVKEEPSSRLSLAIEPGSGAIGLSSRIV